MTEPVETRFSTGAPEPGHADAKHRKSAIRGGVLGYYADQFDIFLPIITLAPAMIYFQSQDTSAATEALIAAFVFASTLIARPLGSAFFGQWADRAGRRLPTLVAIAGFGVSVGAIAFLPGFQHIGHWAIVLLIGLRFVGGFFLGGEYSTAVPLAMEWSPKDKRGLVSGMITCTSPLANATIALITLVLLNSMTSTGLDSSYVQWGWRIPFVIGAIFALTTFVYYVTHVEESPDFEDVQNVGAPLIPAAAPSSPLVQLVKGQHRRTLLQVFVLMSGAWLLTNLGTAVLPSIMRLQIGVPSTTVTPIMMASALVTVVTFVGAAILSQRIGRRRFYVGAGVCAALVTPTAFVILQGLDNSSLAPIVVCVLLIQVSTISLYGPIAAYLTERFPAKIRATGYGVGYSLALVIPAFYAFYITGLSSIFSASAAVPILAVIGGTLVAVGAAFGPETREVDMSK
ncbi:MFS transporter [Rhodococcus sp. 15-1154-1]|nr:MFS transporter [Rhodococcus sp. 15-1154-1]OZF07857.1 MFS transporter [Rhodococcus sp. 15-1154-1]